MDDQPTLTEQLAAALETSKSCCVCQGEECPSCVKADAALTRYDADRAAGRLPEQELAKCQSIIAQHELCHDQHGKVNAEDFANSCASEQRRIYGCAPHADRLAVALADAERLAAAAEKLLYGPGAGYEHVAFEDAMVRALAARRAITRPPLPQAGEVQA